jgi:hypothetical protein
MENPLKFTKDELSSMSRKDLQIHAKEHGLKANAKVNNTSYPIDLFLELCFN